MAFVSGLVPDSDCFLFVVRRLPRAQRRMLRLSPVRCHVRIYAEHLEFMRDSLAENQGRCRGLRLMALPGSKALKAYRPKFLSPDT